MLRRLASAKLAAWLIGVLMLMTLLSVVVPQSSYLGAEFDVFESRYPALASALDSLGLTSLFGGWAISVVALLLFANITACTVLRMQREGRAPGVAAPRGAEERELPTATDADQLIAQAADLLRKARWRILVSSEEGMVAEKGRTGFWGSLILHAGMLVVILGGAITAPTAFYGQLVIADGQTIVDEAASYTKVLNEPEVGDAYTGTRITLESTDLTYDRGEVVETLARMRATDGSGRVLRRDVRVNHPLDVAGKSYLLQSSGYSVSLVVAQPGGNATPLVLNLTNDTPYGWSDSLELAPVNGAPASLLLTATPVPLKAGERAPREEYQLSDPRLQLALRVGDEIQWSGELRQGESVTPADKVDVTFERLGLWNSYYVRGEPARWVSYIGFWMIVIGAAWRFAVPRRRIFFVVAKADDRSVVRVAHRVRPWAGIEADSDRALVGRLIALTGVDTGSSPETEAQVLNS